MVSDKNIRLAEIIPRKYILPELKATTKEEAITEIVAFLAPAGAIKQTEVDDVTKCILDREKLGSTGIGNGIAVPHAKLPGLKKPVGALARAKVGIDFASLDGALTHSIFLFLSCADVPESHVALMSRFVTLIRKPDFVSFLKQTDGQKALHDFFKEVDLW